MNTRQKLAGLVAGIGLCVAAGTVQAGDVAFSIYYSDYDHGYNQFYYSQGYPGNHALRYNPYPGVKFYRRHQGNFDHYYPGQKHRKNYKKHKRHQRLHHDSYYWDKYRSYGMGHDRHDRDRNRNRHERHDDGHDRR